MNNARLQQHFVDIGETTLEVFTGGKGNTTMCFAMHRDRGLTAEGTDVTQALQDECKIILVNARGSGRSSPPDKYPSRGLAADLERVRQHFGVDQWILSGYANGAGSTLVYAIDHPDRVAALIVGFTSPRVKVWEREDSELSPAYPINREFLAKTQLPPVSEPSKWIQIGEDRWVWLVDGQPFMVWPYPISDWARNVFEEIRTLPNPLLQLHRVTAPTLVVAGSKDTLIPVQDCKLIADGIAGAEFLVLTNTAHGYVDSEDRPQHDRALREFVRHHHGAVKRRP